VYAEAALKSFFEISCPDLMCLQEVRPAVLDIIDRTLANTHIRVHTKDARNEKGWNYGQDSAWLEL